MGRIQNAMKSKLRAPNSFHDVHAAIHANGVAGQAPGVGSAEGTGAADVHDVRQFAERRPPYRLIEQEIEVFQSRCRPRLERPRRDGMNPDSLRAQFIGEVAAGSLRQRFDMGLPLPVQ